MGYIEARDQIVSIVQGVAAYDDSNNVWQMRRAGVYLFKHFPDASEKKLPKSRGFWCRAEQRSINTPITAVLPGRSRFGLVVTVAYHTSSDPSVDDENIAFDYRVIASALLLASNWNRPTSTIVSVSAGEDVLLPATIEPVVGARLLRISVPLEVIAA
jgi:hypothetical protein